MHIQTLTDMQKIFAILLFALCRLGVVQATTLSRLVFSGRQLSTVDGLPSNTVYDMLQDRNGFVWMGAAYGLCRYDGYRFTNYYSLGGKSGRRVEANVGNLYEDSRNGRIWIHSATFSFSCYNERTGRFDDYTGRGDEQKAYRRLLLAEGVVWMYDTRNGVRRVSCVGERYVCTDYTRENGLLPSNHVSRMVADARGNVWVVTDAGLLMGSRQGQLRMVARGRYVEANSYRGRVVCLTANGRMEMYAADGRRLRAVQTGCRHRDLETVRSQLVWQGRWMLYGRDTWAINLEHATAAVADEVKGGLLLDTVDGFHFVSDNDGGLWVYPPQGPARRLRLLVDTRFTPDRRRLYKVVRGRDGLFYIATCGNGLFVYDHEQNELRHLSATDPQPVISSNVLTDIMAGNDGTLWIAQESAGVAQVSVTNQSVASFVELAPGHNGDWANFVRMIVHGPQGQVFFSTRDNRLYRYDVVTGKVIPMGETASCVCAMTTDRQGRIWMGTRNSGLYINNVCYRKGDRLHPIPSNQFVDMAEDARGCMWLATAEDGLLMVQTGPGGHLTFTRLLCRTMNESRLHQVKIDSKGHLWVASNNGLYMADIRKAKLTDADFRCYSGQHGELPLGEVHCLCVAKDGSLWIGGKGAGLVRCVLQADGKTLHTTALDQHHGLAANNVTAIVEDRYGQIWAATENGLSVVYDRDLKVKTFRLGTSFHRNVYSDGAALCLADGRLLLGTQAGLTIVTPYDMKVRTGRQVPQVCVTDLSVNGRSVALDSLITFAPGVTRSVTLPATDNTVTFFFSCFDYSANPSSLYQYYLEGVDAGWRPMTSQSSVEYAALSPGTYTFHVRSLTDNQWGDEHTLTVVILQPWYNSLWAWVAYVILFVLVATYLYHNARDKFRLHQQMMVDRQMNEFRIGFFTNIAHEFRTPLAIIQGAVDQLRDSGDRSSAAAVRTARRGTRRLLRMVNRLMEFRKVNTGNMRLQVERGDIVAFVQDIYHDFWTLARQKELHMSFTPFDRHYEVAFDRQVVETVVYNLLSNAVKYTPGRGVVSATLQHQGADFVFTVTDDGPGIDEPRLSALFSPFMQGHAAQGGMGIGLYTAHAMAGLHHGRLDYRRAGADGGSVFTFVWPASDDVYAPDEWKRETALLTESSMADEQADELVRELHPEAYNDVTVLVVEDDPDMMEQVKGQLAVYFHVVACADGESALEALRRDGPELVVCDVMLPSINGYEVVRRIKGDITTAHIPVVMLTALDDDTHQLRSYTAGADDYMVKPCNYRLLVGRCVQLVQNHRNLLRQIDNLQREKTPQGDTSVQSSPQEAVPQLVVTQADKLFKDKIQRLIAQHVGDSDFNVEQLASLLGMGRTTLFTKSKAILGMSPNKFLHNERMRIAARLLADGELSVGEVSYRVGVQDTSYFNKCFKAVYGVSPSKYTRRAEQADE